MPKLLSAKKVAEMLDMSQTTVYDLAKRGEIPSIRIGRHIRFCEERLYRWLAEREGVGVHAN